MSNESPEIGTRVRLNGFALTRDNDHFILRPDANAQPHHLFVPDGYGLDVKPCRDGRIDVSLHRRPPAEDEAPPVILEHAIVIGPHGEAELGTVVTSTLPVPELRPAELPVDSVRWIREDHVVGLVSDLFNSVSGVCKTESDTALSDEDQRAVESITAIKLWE